MYTETLTQRQTIQNGIPPQTLNNATANSSGVDLANARRAMFTLYIGNVTGGGAISAWLQESADNSTWTANGSAGAFSGSGGANTSLTGLNTTNSIITFECNQSNLTPGKRYVRLQIKETGSQNVLVMVHAVGDECQEKPASLTNGTQVATNGSQKVVA